MKAKVLLFRIFIFLTAFYLSIGICLLVEKLNAKTTAQPEIPVQKTFKSTESRFQVETLDSLQIGKDEAAAEKGETEEFSFQPDGEFYSDQYLPREFRDFNFFTVQTLNWENMSEENDYQPENIPPRGFLNAGKEFNFIKISVGNRFLCLKLKK